MTEAAPRRGPQHFDIRPDLNRALAHQNNGEFAAAQVIYDRLRQSHDHDGNLHLCQGECFEMQNRLQEAYASLKRAVQLRPQDPQVWSKLAFVLLQTADLKAAILAQQKAIELDPGNALALSQFAYILQTAFEPELALKAVDMALGIDPDNFAAVCRRAYLLYTLGRFEEARQQYLRALEIRPGDLGVYHDMLRDGGFTEGELARMLPDIETRLACGDLNPQNRAAGAYCAAAIYDRRKDYDRAFAHYSAANAAMRQLCSYSRKRAVVDVDSLIAAYGPETFKALAPAATQTELPVFIVGMPRSGTTLMERILASHSHVFGAGEMIEMQKIDADFYRQSAGADLRYPRDVRAMNSAALKQIGESYIAGLRQKYSQDAARIVDKMPPNYRLVGLISVLFPQARIIHMTRDAMDNCWSCFTNHFTDSKAFAYTFDLEDVAFNYRQYRRLMDHWHKVLPGKVLDVSYEELVDNQEEVSRRVIAHIGLDWEDACLDFHRDKGMVTSQSLWQVRQPIYKSAVQKWRRYEKHLAPLRDALGDYAE